MAGPRGKEFILVKGGGEVEPKAGERGVKIMGVVSS